MPIYIKMICLGGVLAWGLSGCYVGANGQALSAEDTSDPLDPENPSVDTGEDPSSPPVVECGDDSIAPTRIWRLSDSQHAHAIADLLNLESVTEVKTPGTSEDSFVNESELLTVSGPLASQYEQAASDAAAQAMLTLADHVPCDPSTGDEACAEAFINDFVSRAFRRPISSTQLESFLALYRSGATKGFAAGIELVIEATLQAPSFLYRTELGDLDTDQSIVRLDAYELASAISFLLLDSVPDSALWAAAQDGSLEDPQVIEAQVERLLALPRVQDNLVRIFSLWLGVPKAAGLSKSSEHFAEFTESLAEDMVTETELFLRHLIPTGTIGELLTSRTTFVNQSLAKIYGIEGIEGDDFVEVELAEDQRAGVMTHPSMMSILSAPEETSVVHRGLVVHKLLLCNDLPAPPAGVALDDPDFEGLDQRELTELRAEIPACVACHSLIDPVGLTFEHYDPIGRYRSEQNGESIDASADVLGTGVVEHAIELMESFARDPRVSDCISRHMVIYALGRQLGATDDCALERIQQQVDQADGSLIEPFRSIALSEIFRLRKREDG